MYVYITAGTLVMIRLHKKALTAKKIEKFMWMKISFDMGKNGRHRPNSLSSRLIVVLRQ